MIFNDVWIRPLSISQQAKNNLQLKVLKCQIIHPSIHPLVQLEYLFAAREGSRQLQALKPEARMAIIDKLADLLINRKADILAANKKDLHHGYKNGEILMILE